QLLPTPALTGSIPSDPEDNTKLDPRAISIESRESPRFISTLAKVSNKYIDVRDSTEFELKHCQCDMCFFTLCIRFFTFQMPCQDVPSVSSPTFLPVLY